MTHRVPALGRLTSAPSAGRPHTAWVVLFCLCAIGTVLLGGAHRVVAAPAAISPAAYRAELERLLADTQEFDRDPARVRRVMEQVPSAWDVDASGRAFTVSAELVRTDLASLARKWDASVLARLRSRLTRLLSDLTEFEAAQRDTRADRHHLERILARSEFSDVGGPSWFDRLRQAALAWLVDILGRMIGSGNIPAIGRVVVYGVVGLCLLIAALWIHRSLRRSAALDMPPIDVAPVSARDWTAWLADARIAAARGDWRDAVRLAYWAGISSLESRKVWPPDRARTPREYLRLVPAAHEHRPALTALTHTFERVWYARQAADERTFARALTELEHLGCREG